MKSKSVLIKNIAMILFLLAGSLHALATFYWSFGGEIGLMTVGGWTFGMKKSYGNPLLLIMFLIGLFKLLSTWIPLILYYKNNKVIRFTSYIGAIILIIHGGVNTVVGWLKFVDIMSVGFKLSFIGQAFIWDPLFLIWGLGLMTFLIIKNDKHKMY